MKLLDWGLGTTLILGAIGLVAISLTAIMVDRLIKRVRSSHDRREFRKVKRFLADHKTGSTLSGEERTWWSTTYTITTGEAFFVFYDKSLYLKVLWLLQNRANGESGTQRVYIDVGQLSEEMITT